MRTILSTGPAFFSANTTATDKSVAKGKMRINCVRLESYEVDADSNVQFEVLGAAVERDKRLARLVLDLHAVIGGNLVDFKQLKKEHEGK